MEGSALCLIIVGGVLLLLILFPYLSKAWVGGQECGCRRPRNRSPPPPTPMRRADVSPGLRAAELYENPEVDSMVQAARNRIHQLGFGKPATMRRIVPVDAPEVTKGPGWELKGCFVTGAQTRQQAVAMPEPHSFLECLKQARDQNARYFALQNGHECLLFPANKRAAASSTRAGRCPQYDADGASTKPSTDCKHFQTSPDQSMKMAAGGKGFHSVYQALPRQDI